MAKKEKLTYPKSFSSTELTDQQVLELQEKYNLLSPSETIRRCIAEFHAKSFPDYIYKRSAKDMEKRETGAAAKKMEDMDPIKFAEEYIGKVLIGQSEDGHEYMIIHGTANMLNAVRDDAIKKFYTDFSDLVELHQKKAEKTSVASELNNYMVKYLQRQFGIVFPDGLPEGAPIPKVVNETNTEDINPAGESAPVA